MVCVCINEWSGINEWLYALNGFKNQKHYYGENEIEEPVKITNTINKIEQETNP